MPASIGSEIVLFKKFKIAWPTLSHAKFKSGIAEKKVKKLLGSKYKDILLFVETSLEKK